MKTNKRVALLFMSVLGSFVLLFLVLSFGNATTVVYGESINGSLPVDFDLTPGVSKTAYPGAVVPYTHTLTNTGDAGVFTITVNSSQGWDVISQTNPIPLELNNNETGLITVTVSIPFDAAENDQDELVVTVQSTNEMATVTNTTTVSYYKVYLPAVMNPARWEKVGGNWPSNVTGRSLAVCTTNPDIIIAGTIDNGVWVFNGTSWETTTIPTGFSVAGLAMNQACDRTYASLYNGGVWQGQRSGNTWSWSQIGGSEVLLARSLALAGDRPFAAGDFGIRYWDGNTWQTTSGIIGSLPIMYISAADPTDSNSTLYAVQWQVNKVYQGSGNTPTWTQLPQTVPNNEMRVVFGNASEPRFVGTQSGSYQMSSNIWQALSVSAGLRAGVITDTTAYLGYTNYAGIYKVKGSILTPLNAGWNKPPEFIYDLVLADGKLYAATTLGVWAFSQP